MKVGTDGVLLGAWCRVDPHRDTAMLDIGTGTGVIALQLAQRTEGTGAMIDAVEIDPAASLAAARNFSASEWSDRLRLHNVDIKEFARTFNDSEAGYDHVVSNPPYFTGSLTSPDDRRTVARHAMSISYGDLMGCCARLLKPRGRVSLIVPAGGETERMARAADECGFYASRRTDVHSTPRSGPKRTLLEFSRRQSGRGGSPETETEIGAETTSERPAEHTSLVIEDRGPGTFSEEYRALTRDFYLYF